MSDEGPYAEATPGETITSAAEVFSRSLLDEADKMRPDHTQAFLDGIRWAAAHIMGGDWPDGYDDDGHPTPATPSDEDRDVLAAWIAEARQAHAEWVEHLTACQDCPDAPTVGDREHHATWVRRYDQLAAALASRPLATVTTRGATPVVGDAALTRAAAACFNVPFPAPSQVTKIRRAFEAIGIEVTP